MKNKETFGLLINPFTRIAGWQAFGLGLVFILLMGFIGTYNNASFDGVLDIHNLQQMTFARSFSYLAIDLISLVGVMWITGLIISKSFRFVDILGTMTLAKAPLIIMALAGCLMKLTDTTEILKDPTLFYHSAPLIIFVLLALPILIWNITLMYNALKISCDVKGSKLTLAFIIALIVSEIISKILILKLL